MKRLLVVAVMAMSCGPVCRIACPPELQTVILVDANGAGLTPKQLTTGGTTFVCGEGETTCTGNRLTFRWGEYAEMPRDVRVEATTGEVFTGSVDPNFNLKPSPGTCQCGDSSYDDLTVTLSL